MNLLLHAPILAIAVPLLCGLATPLISKFGKTIRDLWVTLGLLFTEFLVLILTHDVLSNGIRIYTLGAKFPADVVLTANFIPIRIILELDAFSVFMALTSVSIALIAFTYSTKFIKEGTTKVRYYTLFLLLITAIVGLVFTGDLFSMFVFLELLSISSAALVAFYFHKGESLEAAFKYIVFSSVGALMVLLAIGLLYGQYNILNIAALANTLKFSFPDKVALALLISAFAMKCGVVPLHMWVSDAYGEAPAPISAVLVVASQASLYALFRISFTLFNRLPTIEIVAWFIIILGILSMVIGVSMAIIQNDIKRLIAYNAVSQVGYMLLGVGVGLMVIKNITALNSFGLVAMEGGIFHIVNDTIIMSLLFLTAGVIIYKTGTKDMNKMSGLAHEMPFTMVLFLIGVLALAGLPPFNGFASKLLIYESTFHFNPLLTIIAILVSILTLASFVKIFYSAFMGPRLKEYNEKRDVPKTMRIAMLVLALLILLLGLFPNIVVDNLISPAAHALIDQLKYVGGVL